MVWILTPVLYSPVRKLVDVAARVLRADVVPRSVQTALQDCPHGFYALTCIGVAAQVTGRPRAHHGALNRGPVQFGARASSRLALPRMPRIRRTE